MRPPVTSRKPTVFLLLAVMILSACATKATISSSPPGVAIFSGDKKLGDTPLEVSSDSLAAGPEGGYLLRLEKDGYSRVWLWMPKGVRGLTMSVNLQPFLAKGTKVSGEVAKAELDVLSAQMLGYQQQLLLGQDVTDEKLQELMKKYPEVASSYFLAAVAQLRKGDKTKALATLATAMRLAPSQPDYVALYRELGGDPLKVMADAPAATKTNETKAAPKK